MKIKELSFLLLAVFLLASCSTSEPSYKKNDGLNKSHHSSISRTGKKGTFCHD